MSTKRIIKLVIAIIFWIIAISAIASAATKENPTAEVIAGVVCAIVGLIVFFTKGKSAEAKAAKQQQKGDKARSVGGTHMAGLPLGEGSQATIRFEDNAFLIESGGNSFDLGYEKVSLAEVKTDVEIQKAYVSSIGGAVGGAVLFGPLGAMVGGRTKVKKETKVEYFLIITYSNEEKVEHVSFQVYNAGQVRKLIAQYSPRFSGQKQVSL